jgi:NAD-dependent deacetylase
MIEHAALLVRSADIFIVVGTSLVVYPAAGLVNFTRPGTHTFIVDKKIPYTSRVDNLTAIELPASQGIGILKEKLESFK